MGGEIFPPTYFCYNKIVMLGSWAPVRKHNKLVILSKYYIIIILRSVK